MSDDIAYNNHDIQDGIKAKLFSLNELLEIDFFKQIFNVNKKKTNIKNKEILLYQIIRDSIDLMVKDLINNTIKNIKYYKIKTLKNVYDCSQNLVCFSDEFQKIEKEIKFFLKFNMYNNKTVLLKNNKGKKIIETLFKIISKKPKKFLKTNKFNKNEKFRSIADFISGMTDRYAINLYKEYK